MNTSFHYRRLFLFCCQLSSGRRDGVIFHLLCSLSLLLSYSTCFIILDLFCYNCFWFFSNLCCLYQPSVFDWVSFNVSFSIKELWVASSLVCLIYNNFHNWENKFQSVLSITGEGKVESIREVKVLEMYILYNFIPLHSQDIAEFVFRIPNGE